MIYYVDNNLNFNEVLLDLVDELLRPKYENVTFYFHNFGIYDSIYLINVLLDYNDNHKDKYILTPIYRDAKPKKLTISKKVGNITHKYVIYDSYNILTSF